MIRKADLSKRVFIFHLYIENQHEDLEPSNDSPNEANITNLTNDANDIIDVMTLRKQQI